MDRIEINKKFEIDKGLISMVHSKIRESLEKTTSSGNDLIYSGILRLEQDDDVTINKHPIRTIFGTFFNGECYLEINYTREKFGSDLFYLKIDLYGKDKDYLNSLKESINTNIGGLVKNA